MIIGLVGPVSDDVNLVSDLLTEENSIQVVDGVEVLRLCDRKTLNSIISKDYHKQYLVKKLESNFETVVITGNLLLTTDMCKYILDEGGLIVVVSRKHLEDYDDGVIALSGNYWDNESVQRYNLETKYQDVFKALKKHNSGVDNLFLIDLSDEESGGLEALVESSADWPESTNADCTSEGIIELIKTEEDNTMNMEESIKKAMLELGMDISENSGDTLQKSSNKTTKVVKEKSSKPIKKVDLGEPVTPEETVSEESEESSVESIFVKIADGTMALLLPEGLVLKSQEISGMKFNVATVELPDFTSHKLQELDLKLDVTPKQETSNAKDKSTKEQQTSKPSQKPKTKLPEAPKVSKIVVDSGDMSELKEEKLRLDREIKKFRELGDVESVNSLRKQRRAVRNKINTLSK